MLLKQGVEIMKKGIIISSVLTIISLVLGCFMLFAELPEYEFFLIIEAISVLLFSIAVVTVIFSYALLKKQCTKMKTGYKIVVLFLIVITALYIPCAFISCHDEYTPEMQYVNNKDYIQKFLPITDVNEIKTRDDLLQSSIGYTNYPGFSELYVVDMNINGRYDLVYTKSLNPVYNIRSIITTNLTLKAEAINGDWVSDIYNINGTKVHIYTNEKDMVGCISYYGNMLTVFVTNYKEFFISEEAFAEYLCEQYKLIDENLTAQIFRDEPWYNVPFYINALTEPYEDSKYFA